MYAMLKLHIRLANPANTRAKANWFNIRDFRIPFIDNDLTNAYWITCSACNDSR